MKNYRLFMTPPGIQRQEEVMKDLLQGCSGGFFEVGSTGMPLASAPKK